MMGAIIPLIGRIVAWGMAGFITQRVVDVATPLVEEKTGDDKFPETASRFDNFKKKWRTAIIIAVLVGIIALLFRFIFKRLKLEQ